MAYQSAPAISKQSSIIADVSNGTTGAPFFTNVTQTVITNQSGLILDTNGGTTGAPLVISSQAAPVNNLLTPLPKSQGYSG